MSRNPAPGHAAEEAGGDGYQNPEPRHRRMLTLAVRNTPPGPDRVSAQNLDEEHPGVDGRDRDGEDEGGG
jgi:hypothetical protein